MDCYKCKCKISLRVGYSDGYKLGYFDPYTNDKNNQGVNVCYDCLSQKRKNEIEKELEKWENEI